MCTLNQRCMERKSVTRGLEVCPRSNGGANVVHTVGENFINQPEIVSMSGFSAYKNMVCCTAFITCILYQQYLETNEDVEDIFLVSPLVRAAANLWLNSYSG